MHAICRGAKAAQRTAGSVMGDMDDGKLFTGSFDTTVGVWETVPVVSVFFSAVAVHLAECFWRAADILCCLFNVD